MTRQITEWYNPACYVLQPYGTICDSTNPAAYALPRASSAGGILCNPGVGGVRQINGPTTGVCYTTSTARTTDQLGSLGDQRQIQFAVKFMF